MVSGDVPAHWQHVKIEPGPGFGDASHPTTLLTLQLISRLVAGRDILDIGCGSGILSLSALALNAASVIGYDIAFEAILHSIQNAKLNGRSCEFFVNS